MGLEMADKEEMREEYASKAFADALSKHVKVDFEHTFIKGFISFTTTDDLHLTTGYTMHEGLYLLDVRDKGDKIPIEEFVHLKVFAVAYDEEKMLEFVKKAEKANGSNEPVTQEGALKLVPATIDGKPVEFGILPGLYAIQDAKKEDKQKLTEAMFGSITEDKQPKKDELRKFEKATALMKPDNHSSMNTKLSQYINDARLFDEFGIELDVASSLEKKAGKAVTVPVKFISPEKVSLTKFDREVIDAVGTIWDLQHTECGEPLTKPLAVTTRDIARIGLGVERPSKTLCNAINGCIDKLSVVKGEIRFESQARGKKLKNFYGEEAKEGYLKKYIIAANEAGLITRNGHETEGWSILEMPLLYAYAQLTGEMVTYPNKLLTSLSEAGSVTPKTIVIRGELLRRINQMERHPDFSRRIRYYPDPNKPKRRGFMELCEVDTSQSRTVERAADYIKSALEVLKKNSEIKDYHENTQGSSHKRVGVDIILNKLPKKGYQIKR